MILLLWLALIGGILCYGVWLVKLMDQVARDRKRKTYRLNHPADLSPEGSLTFQRSISGTLRGGKLNLTGAPGLAYETFASSTEITHRFKVPYGHEPYIIPQLRLTGINATPEDEFKDRDWIAGVELGVKNTSHQLRIFDIADVSTSILSALQAFQPDEALIIQIIATPAPPTKLPEKGDATHQINWNGIWTHGILAKTEASKDEIKDRREKLEEPNFNVVIRIAASAKTKAAAAALVSRIQMAFAATRGPNIRFYRRWITLNALRDRIRTAHTPVIMPGQFSAPELVSFIAWPHGRPRIAGLAPSMTRHIPVASTVPSEGRRIGISTMPGNERPVAVAYKHTLKHSWVLGPSGVGKTTLLANMAAQDMANGYGLVLVEAKRDLFHEVLKRVPDNRIDDVIVFDIEDGDFPLGFNVLDQGNNANAIDEVCGTIAKMYSGVSQSIQAPQILYQSLHALAETPGHTFIDLPRLLEKYPNDAPESEWQHWLAANTKDPDAKKFLERLLNMSPAERDRYVMPVLNRTWEFTNRRELKRILGQRQSSFKMVDVIRDNKILLVNLDSQLIGEQTAALVGTLIVNSVWRSVRQVQAEKPNFLYLDEFQDFVDLPVGIEAVMAKARSYNLGLTLAHQELGQLSKNPQLKSAVMANTATKIVFQPAADDAGSVVRAFANEVKADELLHLGAHETMSRIATDLGSSPVATVRTYAPSRETGNEGKARNLSQNRYGRPLEDVLRDLDNRPGGHSDKPRPPKRKVTGGDLF
jgi:hypothetical protein